MAITSIAPSNKQSWTCNAPVPNVKTNKRHPCGAANRVNTSRCDECGAPRDFSLDKNNSNTTTTTNSISNKEKIMNDTVKPVKPTTTTSKPVTKPTTTVATPDVAKPAPVATSTDTKASVAEKAPRPEKDLSKPETYKGLPRIRFYSTAQGKEEYCVRILPIFLDRYGAPKDPWGNTMEQRTDAAGGSIGAVPKKVLRAEAKEAEKAKVASMSDEEKLAYAKAKREAAIQKKDADKKAQREKLMAELKSELEKEGLAIVPAAKAPASAS